MQFKDLFGWNTYFDSSLGTDVWRKLFWDFTFLWKSLFYSYTWWEFGYKYLSFKILKALVHFLLDYRISFRLRYYLRNLRFLCFLIIWVWPIFLSEVLCVGSEMIQECLQWCRLGWVYIYSFVCALDETFQSETYIWKILWNHFHNCILSVFPASEISYM